MPHDFSPSYFLRRKQKIWETSACLWSLSCLDRESSSGSSRNKAANRHITYHSHLLTSQWGWLCQRRAALLSKCFAFTLVLLPYCSFFFCLPSICPSINSFAIHPFFYPFIPNWCLTMCRFVLETDSQDEQEQSLPPALWERQTHTYITLYGAEIEVCIKPKDWLCSKEKLHVKLSPPVVDFLLKGTLWYHFLVFTSLCDLLLWVGLVTCF